MAVRMKNAKSKPVPRLLQIVALLSVVLGTCSCSKHVAPELIDRSTINMVALSDGSHPWLSITLLRDPTEKDLCPLRWSPTTRTLAYLDSDRLCTWNPSNQLQLDSGKNWQGLTWSPNGASLVVSCPDETLVVDAQTMKTKRTYRGQWIVWWQGETVCAVPREDPSKRTKKDAQTVDFDGKSLILPAGLTVVAASPDGRALLAQENLSDNPSGGPFILLGLDKTGTSVIWIKPAPTKATKDYAFPDLIWNERYQLAAETVDNGGGYDLHAYAEANGQTLAIEFASQANYSWVSGPMSWTGDEMFVPLTLARVVQASGKTTNVHFWNELALVDGKSHSIRSVSAGLPYESAAASPDYVAMIVEESQGAKIIVTPWDKDESGKILGLKYNGDGSAHAEATKMAQRYANTVGYNALYSTD